MFKIEQTNDDIIFHNKYGEFSKNKLESQLINEHLTVKRLGILYDLNESQIIHVLRTLKITFRNKLENTRVIVFKIIPMMHQVLLGTLLGDGYMRGNNIYGLGHSINQMDYFYNVAENLNQLTSSISYKECKLGKSLELFTHHHSSLIPYFNRFYTKGKEKKFFTEESAYDLEPIGLAYWFMDDGKFDEYGFYLCVGNITQEEGTVLVNLLKNKFNLSSNMQIHDKNKGYHNIYIKAESRSHFISLIEPYIPDSMKYKLIGEPYPILKNPSEIIDRHSKYCYKINRQVNFHGIDKIKKH
jgi:hypothetical protein